MLHNFSTLAMLCWVTLTGAFFYLCFFDWLEPPATEQVFFCGTQSYDTYDSTPSLKLGKTIFRNNCASCHAGDMKTDLTGPALGAMRTNWQDHGGDQALYTWIRNSQKMIEADTNVRARELWQLWGPTVMNSFQNLTDEELDAVVEYVETQNKNNGYMVAN